ncbi:MAG: hypothetical protein RR614_00105 [Eubacterium sp.]
MKEGKIKRILQLMCLSIGATVIYFVPIHLRSIFYLPMQEVFGYTNTEIGNLAGLYGVMSIVTYFPGGRGYTLIFAMGTVSSCMAVMMLLIFRKRNKERIQKIKGA